MNQRVPASPDSAVAEQMCDILISKLAKRLAGMLPSKQDVASWNLVSRSN